MYKTRDELGKMYIINYTVEEIIERMNERYEWSKIYEYMQHKGLVNLSSSQSQIEFYSNISPNLKNLSMKYFS